MFGEIHGGILEWQYELVEFFLSRRFLPTSHMPLHILLAIISRVIVKRFLCLFEPFGMGHVKQRWDSDDVVDTLLFVLFDLFSVDTFTMNRVCIKRWYWGLIDGWLPHSLQGLVDESDFTEGISVSARGGL